MRLLKRMGLMAFACGVMSLPVNAAGFNIGYNFAPPAYSFEVPAREEQVSSTELDRWRKHGGPLRVITRDGADGVDYKKYKVCTGLQSLPENFTSYKEFLNPDSDLRKKLGLTHVDSEKILRVMLDALKSSDNKNQVRDILAALSYIFRLHVSVERRLRDLKIVNGFVGIFKEAQDVLNNPPPEIQNDGLGIVIHNQIRNQYNQQVPMMRQVVEAMGNLGSFQSYKATYIAGARSLIQEGLKQTDFSLSDLRRLSKYAKHFEAKDENVTLWNMYLEHPDIDTFSWVINSTIMKAWEAYHPYTVTLPWVATKAWGGMKRLTGRE